LFLFVLSLSLTSIGCDDAPTPIPDAGVPDDPTAVTVKRVLRYHTATGVETVPDISAPPELYILDGTALRRIDGTTTDDGSLRFTGVPAGTPYYLKSGSNYFVDYVVTDARAVDLSRDMLGRPDAGLASESSEAAAFLSVSGLEPADLEQPAPPYLEVVSGEVGFSGYLRIDTDFSPGQSTYVGEGRVYNIGGPGFPQFSAERGDRAWVNQFTTHEAGRLSDGGTLRYSLVVRSLQLPPFSHDGGAPLQVRGEFQPVPMTDVSLDWHQPAFAAYAQAAHPGATPGTSEFNVSPRAHGLEHGWVGDSGGLLYFRLPRGTAEELVLPLRYGNPFPSTWGEVGSATYYFRYPTRLSSGTAVTVSASMGITDRMSALAAGGVVPRISPPRGLAIDGQDAYVARRLEGSPVVSWTPPELGTPSLYTLSLDRYGLPSPEFPQPNVFPVARFHLPGSARSVRLPPDILQPGQDYVLRLSAYASPGVDLSSAPLVIGNRVPLYRAGTVSAILTTP
jgi:hypothetical protein